MRVVGITRENYPDEKHYQFTRSAFIYSWLACSVSTFYTFFYWSIGAKGAAISLGAMSIVIVLTHVLYASGRSVLLARIDLVFSCFALGGVVLHTGGINASSSAWLLGTIPGISAILFKRVEYIIGLTALTIFLYCVIFILEMNGFNVHQLGFAFGSTQERVYTFVHFVGFSLFLAIILSVFSITQKNLYERLEENKEELEHVLTNLNIIFESINQAIFTVNEKGIIGESRSDKFDNILHKSHNTIYEIFDHCDLGDEGLAMMEEVIGFSIGVDTFQFEMNSHLLPKKVNYVKPESSREQVLSLQWSPIINADTVRSILVVIQDITDIESAKHDIAEKRKRNEILLSLIENLDADLSAKIDALDLLCNRLNKALANQDIAEIKVLVHTIKGNARQLTVKNISELCHNIEEMLLLGKDDYVDEGRHLTTLLDEYINIYKAHFKNFSDTEYDSDMLAEVQNFIETTSPQNPLLDRIKKANRVNIKSLAHPIVEESVEVAKNLQKPTPRFIFEGLENNIPKNYRSALSNSLGHLMRNSLDHGIEGIQERKENQKSISGEIFIQAKLNQDRLDVIYSDDGRGLNLQRITDRATQAGIETSTLGNEEIYKLIFHEDLSTSSSVTEISGRGVGMTAVMSEISQIGGSTDLVVSDSSANNIDFKIVIHLPALSA